MINPASLTSTTRAAAPIMDPPLEKIAQALQPTPSAIGCRHSGPVGCPLWALLPCRPMMGTLAQSSDGPPIARLGASRFGMGHESPSFFRLEEDTRRFSYDP